MINELKQIKNRSILTPLITTNIDYGSEVSEKELKGPFFCLSYARNVFLEGERKCH